MLNNLDFRPKVSCAAVWPSLEAHYLRAIRECSAAEPSLPPAASDAAKALLRARAFECRAVPKDSDATAGSSTGQYRALFWRFVGVHTAQRYWLAISLSQTLAMAFLMGALSGKAQVRE